MNLRLSNLPNVEQLASGGTPKKNMVELLSVFSLRNFLSHTFLLFTFKARFVLKDFPDHLS